MLKHFDPDKIQRLLVRGTNWVGDAVMVIPALQAIRRRFANAHVTLLVQPWVKDVYGAIDFADEILTYQKPGRHEGWLGVRRLALELRLRRFEMSILLQNAIEAALVAFWARIPLRIGYARDGRSLFLTHPITIDPAVKEKHQAYYYLGILAGAGLMEARPWDPPGTPLGPISIGITRSDADAARELLRRCGVGTAETIIGINPGAAYGGAKRWPAERFAAAADALANEFKARIIIFGSPGDVPVAREVAARMAVVPVVLAGRTTLGQLMALIRECDLFVTNDSGPMHLAAALSVPQLAIFGSTSEIATGPLSDRARVIKHQVDCNPCFLRECPTDFRCMLGISAERVINEARAILSPRGVTGKDRED
jgi:heptosyltransferase-2